MRRGVGEGVRIGETHVCTWLIHVDIWQKKKKTAQYCKVITFQLNKLKNQEVIFSNEDFPTMGVFSI